MGIFSKLKKDEPIRADEVDAIDAQAAPDLVCAPISGAVVPRLDVEDKAFAEGLFGRGCGIEPEGEIVYAPVTGTVTAEMAGSRHAIGFTGEGGTQVIIHVGIGTVSMEGKGFTYLATQGESVTAGQPVLAFSKEAIEKAGYSDIVTISISNADDFKNVELLVEDHVEAGQPLLKVTRP